MLWMSRLADSTEIIVKSLRLLNCVDYQTCWKFYSKMQLNTVYSYSLSFRLLAICWTILSIFQQNEIPLHLTSKTNYFISTWKKIQLTMNNVVSTDVWVHGEFHTKRERIHFSAYRALLGLYQYSWKKNE